MCLSPHFVPTPNGGSPVVLVQAPPQPQATPPSGTIPAASAPAAAAEMMSPGPREAHQDGDELRAGVESLISGPGVGWGWVAGPHQCRWEEGRGLLCSAVLRTTPDESLEPRRLTVGRNCCVPRHRCGSKGHFAQPHTTVVPHARQGSLLPALTTSKVPVQGRLGVEKGRGGDECWSEMQESLGPAGSGRKGTLKPPIRRSVLRGIFRAP